MSDRDPDDQMSQEVEELLERASSPEPAPPEARERVWSEVAESVGADPATDPGDPGDGSASADGGTEAQPPGTGPESGASMASTGGLGQALGGAGLVQTAVAFLVGTGVGAGGYALLQDGPTEPRDDRQVAAGPADTGPVADAAADTSTSADIGTDTGRPDTGTPDTNLDDTAAPDISTEPDAPDDSTRTETTHKPASEESSPSEPTGDAPAEPTDDAGSEPPTDRTPDASSRPDATLSAERVLLSRAQSALARDRPEEALEALDTHERRFSDGELLEERRALRIRALLRTGRRDEARRRAREFLETYPNSIFREAVTPALDGADAE